MPATRLSIFPLPGAILFPGLQLPLHIFEPRYRTLVGSALARDRRIAMIQPQGPDEGAPLYAIGCVGRIGDVEALDDGRYNIVLEGEARPAAEAWLSGRASLALPEVTDDVSRLLQATEGITPPRTKR